VNNKPKYHLFRNTRYAVEGFIYAFKTESSFRLELLCSVFIIIGIIIVDTTLTNKLILLTTGILVLIVELLNSAVENVVDLVTKEYAPLAKTAKDIGAAAVMISITLHTTCWIFILI
jgi:diacylglycerol kinase (ATP)